MKFTRVIAGCAITTMCCCAVSVLTDEENVSGFRVIEPELFSKGVAIQELRDRSTKAFELLDENQSGSITLDEIDLTEMQADVSSMSPEKLRNYYRRSSAIQNKFMSWSTEIDEFEVVDTNQDGVWNKDEYEVRFEMVQKHRLELGIEEWDKDGNGAVELHEFNSHLDELELLDENADGTVSHEEAFKSKNNRVINDMLLHKLALDNMVFTSFDAPFATGTATNIEMEVEVKKKNEE